MGFGDNGKSIYIYYIYILVICVPPVVFFLCNVCSGKCLINEPHTRMVDWPTCSKKTSVISLSTNRPFHFQ